MRGRLLPVRSKLVPGVIGELKHKSENLALVLWWQGADQWMVSAGITNFSGTAGGTKFVEKVDVCLVIVGPFIRHIIFVVDGFNWADRFAGAAVNTFIRVNVERALTFIDTIYRALFDARLVFNRSEEHTSELQS